MERLWAPWRGQYITSLAGDTTAQDQINRCVFCDLLDSDPEDDRANLVLYRGQSVCILMNKFPYNNGHLLVMPKHHVGHFDGLTSATFDELHLTVAGGTKALQVALKPDGVNVGLNLGKAAGAGIPEHMHYHLVPRWNGDSNFMPVIGETKVISQHILATYDALIPQILQQFSPSQALTPAPL